MGGDRLAGDGQGAAAMSLAAPMVVSGRLMRVASSVQAVSVAPTAGLSCGSWAAGGGAGVAGTSPWSLSLQPERASRAVAVARPVMCVIFMRGVSCRETAWICKTSGRTGPRSPMKGLRQACTARKGC